VSRAPFEEIIPFKDKTEYQINQIKYVAHRFIRDTIILKMKFRKEN
jgi:hypothetical protein